jgi:hypothetical protein
MANPAADGDALGHAPLTSLGESEGPVFRIRADAPKTARTIGCDGSNGEIVAVARSGLDLPVAELVKVLFIIPGTSRGASTFLGVGHIKFRRR